MIREIQNLWEKASEKDITFICNRYKISKPTAYPDIQKTGGETPM